MRGRGAVLALILVAACAPRAVRPRGTVVGLPADVDAVVRRALTADAAGDATADTLYAPDAIVVGNARIRLAAPRFAGVSYGGRLNVAASAVTLEGRFAWVMVDYRWVGADPRQVEVGRATFICEQRGSRWKIVHAHSSQQLPWDR